MGEPMATWVDCRKVHELANRFVSLLIGGTVFTLLATSGALTSVTPVRLCKVVRCWTGRTVSGWPRQEMIIGGLMHSIAPSVCWRA